MRIMAFLLTCTLLYGSEIDDIIRNIASKRSILTESQIAATADAFEKQKIVADNNETNKTVAPKLELKAILDGQALVNDKWLKVGDVIHGYKLSQIGAKSVMVTGKKESKTLYIFKGGK